MVLKELCDYCTILNIFQVKLFLQPKNLKWRKMKLNNPKLKIHFEIESIKSSKDVFLFFNPSTHSEIPCYSIVLDNPHTQVVLTRLNYKFSI